MYKSLNEAQELCFSGCDQCQESCCDGSKFILAPLVLDDFKRVYKKFLIAFAVFEHRVKAVMLLSNKFSPCLYYKEGKCSIYEERPPVCKIYPYTPYFDDVLIDTACEGVGHNGMKMVREGECLKERMLEGFYDERFENFMDKLADTDIFLEKLGFEFRPILEIEGVKLLEYIGSQQNSFIQMHKASLEFLVEWRD